MGANPRSYLIDYQPDINAALQILRQQEFRAGRYFPTVDYASFPLYSGYVGPGA